MSTPSPVDMRALFGRLAADLGAIACLPRRDGSVEFQYRDQATLPNGSVLFRLPGGHTASVSWPGERVASGAADQQPILSSREFPEKWLAVIRQRLARVASGHRLDGHEPFSVVVDPQPMLTLSARSLQECLVRFLRPGITCWGAWTFDGFRDSPTGVVLTFRCLDQALPLEVRVGSCIEDDAPEGPWPVHRSLVLVTMSESVASENGNELLDYVLYALSRAVHPLQEFGAGTPESIPDVPRATTGKAGGSAVQGRSPEDPLFDSRDELNPWCFFVPSTERGLGAFESVGTMLDADPGVALVSYVHRACTTKVPILDDPSFVGGMWYRFFPLPITYHRKRVDIPHLAELDLVLGDQRVVRDEIRTALANPRTRIIGALGSCLGELVGLDLPGMIREEAAGRPVNVVTIMARPEAGTPVAEVWQQAFRLAAPQGREDPLAVNLVGFAAEDTRWARQLRDEVALVGLSVNALVIPSLRTGPLAAFRDAGHTFVNRDAMVRDEFRLVRPTLGDVSMTDVLPPFGPAGCLHFYSEIARACGLDDASTRAAALWAPFKDRFESWKRRAECHEAAFVVTAEDLAYFEEPCLLYGLPLPALMLEMGFSIRFVVVSDDADGGTALKALEELSTRFPSVITARDRIALDGCRRREIRPKLASIPSSLVFTEYPPDSRILGAGKMSFHPRDFQMGCAGALATIIRLVRLAECRFFRTLSSPSHSRAGGTPE